MMKVWTFSLSGTALNWAVEMVECDGAMYSGRECRPFSTDWAVGGPIIERGGIGLWTEGFEWEAKIQTNSGEWIKLWATTPLIAAMRCYVLSRLGDEIEVPDELCETTMEVAG